MIWWKLAAILHLWLLVDRATCSPTKSSSCWGGRPWASGNWSCVELEPFLLVGLGNTILRMNLDGRGQERVVSGVGKSMLLDFHFRAGTVYWINIHSGVLSRADLDGTHKQKLLSLGKGISGLTVDWIENTIFWSSKKRGTIQQADSDGKNKKTVLRNLSQPSSLAIDANERFLFWLSAGVTPSIQRSDTAGGVRTTVLKVPDRLLALAVDAVDRRLFWFQQGSGKPSALGSCDYNGNLINVVSQPIRSKSLKMSIFLDHVYMTDSASNSLTRVNKFTGGRPKKVNSKKLLHAPADVKVIHPINQPVAEVSAPLTSGCDPQTEDCVSVCSSLGGSGQCNCRKGFTLSKQGGYCEDINECALWNHGCSLGCENVPGSYFCTCPEGYLLLPDTKTCREIQPCVENATLCDHACTHTQEGDVCVCPVGSVLQPDGHSCTGCLSADSGGCSQVCVTLSPGRWECECQPGYQLQPDGQQCKATGPPAFLLFANGVDIRRVSMDGSGSRTLLEDPEGSLRAVDYDPVQSMVYFASTERKQIERISMDGRSRELLLSTGLDSSPEGLALDWVNRKLYWTDRGSSSIRRSGLDGQDREMLIFEKLLKPRGIAVHPQAQKLFWTDVGSHPAVERSGLDGLGREVLVSAGLVTPSGLALDFSSQRLYWSDLTTGLIESARMDGSDRRTLTQNQVGRPFAVAVFEDTLLVSNWGDNQLYQLDKKTGHNPEPLSVETVQPAAIVIIHPLNKPGADLCLHGNGGCSQLCESRLGLAQCSCHSQHVLSADGKTCLPKETSSTGSGGREWRDHLKNKTLNDESLPSDSGEPAAFTEKMVSDQDKCFSLSCDVNAQCVLDDTGAVCRCLSGFTGDGQICVDIDECTLGFAECMSVRSECVNTAGGYFCQCRSGFSGDGHHCIDIDECRLEMHSCDVNAECLNTQGHYECRCRDGYSGSGFNCHAKSKDAPFRPTTSSTPDITSPWRRSGVESCPSSYDSYCLYNGICFYFPEMDSYGCNCMPGYMGERCQFSDLEWWELQQAEQEKRRNVAIAVCIALLILLLAITASITYCYRCRRFLGERPKDSMSETSMSEDSMTETPSSTPQLYVVLHHGACSNGKMLHTVGCQRRTVCPSCSSETGESCISEDAGTLKREKKQLDLAKCSSSCNISKPGTPPKSSDNLISLDDPQPKTPQLL
ncbi:pro-epidermal growth factor [Colossoma macropomum]|uniref:pro-epidermal growth factor n=1 Tax=Colossoma macropomum TaxID=42526 RepID=UPI00186469F3|nr:pro-epidermal growth factor [Colossoma macropomum]